MPPPPARGAVLLRVQQLTQSLAGAIDEGTGAALDPMIAAWVAAWIATVEAEYTDHSAPPTSHAGPALGGDPALRDRRRTT
ncbi:MAG: hypothetical protein ACXV5Q_08515 [Frankiaceae bacterium]